MDNITLAQKADMMWKLWCELWFYFRDHVDHSKYPCDDDGFTQWTSDIAEEVTSCQNGK